MFSCLYSCLFMFNFSFIVFFLFVLVLVFAFVLVFYGCERGCSCGYACSCSCACSDLFLFFFSCLCLFLVVRSLLVPRCCACIRTVFSLFFIPFCLARPFRTFALRLIYCDAFYWPVPPGCGDDSQRSDEALPWTKRAPGGAVFVDKRPVLLFGEIPALLIYASIVLLLVWVIPVEHAT